MYVATLLAACALAVEVGRKRAPNADGDLPIYEESAFLAPKWALRNNFQMSLIGIVCARILAKTSWISDIYY
jgi:hypothetical protein